MYAPLLYENEVLCLLLLFCLLACLRIFQPIRIPLYLPTYCKCMYVRPFVLRHFGPAPLNAGSKNNERENVFIFMRASWEQTTPASPSSQRAPFAPTKERNPLVLKSNSKQKIKQQTPIRHTPPHTHTTLDKPPHGNRQPRSERTADWILSPSPQRP